MLPKGVSGQPRERNELKWNKLLMKKRKLRRKKASAIRGWGRDERAKPFMGYYCLPYSVLRTVLCTILHLDAKSKRMHETSLGLLNQIEFLNTMYEK